MKTHKKSVRYLYETNTTVIIISNVNCARFHLASTIISEVNLFVNVIHSSADLYSEQFFMVVLGRWNLA